jgi:translocation and assembly module TamA
VGSAEYQHLLNRTLALAGFVDVGNAADSLRDLKPKVGVGVGVRWFTPVGPLNADLAWGLDPGQWRFYVSIGVLF